MKKYPLLFFLWLLAATGYAQPKKFDIFSYTAPGGFVLIDSKDKLFLELKEKKEYCQLVLYPATAGTADVGQDFDKFWDFFARRKDEGVNDPLTKQKDVADGWQVIMGGAQGAYNGKPYIITVITSTKGAITFSAAAVFTQEKYAQPMQDFIASIHPDLNQYAKGSNKAAAPPIAQQPAGGKVRIAKTVTPFNDDWTSTAYDDYVSIVKNDAEVRLVFPDPALDKKRPSNTSNFEAHYWDNVLRKYYRVTGQVLLIEKPAYSYGENDIWLAPAADIASGRQGYVAMILCPNNGGTTVITVFASNKAFLDAHFSKTADFNRMLGYNKFNATTPDIVGEWKNSTGAGLEYYNVYTGNSVGMATAHVSDHFIFNNNATYRSEHTGTGTFQGSLTHGKSNYAGTFKLSDVTLTASGRGAGDPGEFTCYFEAVKYGFTLRLINKKYAGINMSLYKVR
jgi:hypothetical protein